jgi:hypothetical protein
MGSATYNVFLNVPYDKSYENQFVALVAAIVCYGCTPRCALEVPDDSHGRLKKIVGLLKRCEASVHDLSYVRLRREKFRVPRFNMPFEAGIAYRVASERNGKHRKHQVFLLEAVAGRLHESLSDLDGISPQIHRGTCKGTLAAVADCLARREPVSLVDMEAVRRKLAQKVEILKDEESATTVFTTRLFRPMVVMATELAARKKVIRY